MSRFVEQELFSTMFRIESKDLFLDLRKNRSGVFLKLSERTGKARNTVIIPASGLTRLKAILTEIDELIQSKNFDSPSCADNFNVEIARSVYIAGLAWSTTKEGLVAHFSQAGHVTEATILTKKRSGKVVSLGCGLVQYSCREEAAQAVEVLNDTDLDGRLIKCRADREVARAPSMEADAGTNTHSGSFASASLDTLEEKVPESCKVFVAALPWKTTAEELVILFGPVGEVISAEVVTTKKGRSLGHAVLQFAHPDSVEQAIEQFNGLELEGRALAVRQYYEK
ncbi:hypothetical protein B484DRAFT_395252 [Ochromonadaceae sp. CCMP2298]|nr:hypothetical protein B484DRAFT_395252 [Ochromonadaceae sp. CCMP2298]